MDELVLEGKVFIKAAKAAKNLGYATDYVGQLCRSGKIDAHLIGRTWYVNEAQLSTHRVEKKRMSRVKARAYAKKSIEEQKLKTANSQNIYKNIDIRYESDPENLIPTVKKVTSNSTKIRATHEPEKSIETKSIGKDAYKIDITNAETNTLDEEHIDSFYTENSSESILGANPTILKVEEVYDQPKIGLENAAAGSKNVKPRFVERLEREHILHNVPVQEIHEDQTDTKVQATMETPVKSPSPRRSSRKLHAVLLLLVTVLAVLTTLPLSTLITYTENGNTESKIEYSVQALIEIIDSKI